MRRASKNQRRDHEGLNLAHDPAFRNLIASRRRIHGATVPHETLLEEAKGKLAGKCSRPDSDKPARRK
jgi:hypothetical protein